MQQLRPGCNGNMQTFERKTADKLRPNDIGRTSRDWRTDTMYNSVHKFK